MSTDSYVCAFTIFNLKNDTARDKLCLFISFSCGLCPPCKGAFNYAPSPSRSAKMSTRPAFKNTCFAFLAYFLAFQRFTQESNRLLHELRQIFRRQRKHIIFQHGKLLYPAAFSKVGLQEVVVLLTHPSAF